MTTPFENRVFGAAIVKAVNSNYNADFTGLPRTLPDGTVYATDKAFKYTVKNYIIDVYPDRKIFYFKNLNENMNPISLDENYERLFGKYPEEQKQIKNIVAKNLLSCIDVRFFGATFAGKTNISVHGPVQINHGVNIWHENNIFTEQITSPFSNKSNDPDAERGMTTIGRQSKLQEGHYFHHFSINPKNLEEILNLAGNEAENLSIDDIEILKEAMRRGATYYDSASKAGTENEMLIWVQLRKESRLVLPNFVEFIKMKEEKEDNKVVLDLSALKNELEKYKDQIEKVEIYLNQESIKIENVLEGAKLSDL
jgi:CRISPR-associated protein Csh2